MTKKHSKSASWCKQSIAWESSSTLPVTAIQAAAAIFVEFDGFKGVTRNFARFPSDRFIVPRLFAIIATFFRHFSAFSGCRVNKTWSSTISHLNFLWKTFRYQLLPYFTMNYIPKNHWYLLLEKKRIYFRQEAWRDLGLIILKLKRNLIIFIKEIFGLGMRRRSWNTTWRPKSRKRAVA